MDLSNLSNLNAHALGLFNLSSGEIAFRILASIFLGLLIAIVFEKTDRGLENNKYTYKVLIFCPAIISTALMALGNSIATAFGLFAALSIIRFRTPIKNIREMLFIFFSIAIGICTGVGSIKIAGISTAIILIGLGLDYIWTIRKVILQVHNLSLYIKPDDYEELNPVLDNLFKDRLEKFNLLEMRTTSNDSIEMTYTITPKTDKSLPGLIGKLNALESIDNVILQTPFLD